MVYRPISKDPADPRLGRLIPDDFEHVEKYPLTAGLVPEKPVPVALGVNWYSNFDNPVKKGNRWWIGLDSKNLGSIRGGHCICLEPGDELNPDGTIKTRLQDSATWYQFYDQGHEGACVGFGSSRMMSLLNRKRYFARWLWDRAKQADDWSDTNPGDDNGTSVNAAMKVLASSGHVAWKSTYESMNTDGESGDAYPRSGLVGSVSEGISAYRWARSADEVHAALKSPVSNKTGAVRVLNSWGSGYPSVVWMPDETLQRLISEDGEAAVVTDR